MDTRSLDIPELQTTRLRLEPLSFDHSEDMFRMWSKPAVQEFSGPALDANGQPISLPAQSRDASDRLIEFWIKAEKDGWGFRWAIVILESQTFAGHVGFNSLDRTSEIAYHMDPDYWGRGFMREAATAAIHWSKKRGTREIEAFVEPENTKSILLTQRLGMSPTGAYSEGAERYAMTLST